MAKRVLIKPMLTEKSNEMIDKDNKFTFQVDRAANKVEIKKAIEQMYNVQVEKVRTLILPAKPKVRNTKNGIQRGSKKPIKKAIITLAYGEEIDLYGEV